MDPLIGTANFTVDEWESKSANGRTPDEYRANAQATLEALQRRRDALGVPIYITNAWRSDATNAAISGSAKDSQHLTGDAVDFVVPGLAKRDVAATLDTAESAGVLGDYHQMIYYLTDDHYHLGTGSGSKKLVLLSKSNYVTYTGPDMLGVGSKIVQGTLAAIGVYTPTDADPEPTSMPWGIFVAAALGLILLFHASKLENA